MTDRPWMADIKTLVAEHYGVAVGELMSERRGRSIVWPRHVAMYLCRRHTPNSLPRIGLAFGGRDHTTVLYAVGRVEARMAHSGATRLEVDALSAEIDPEWEQHDDTVDLGASKAARRSILRNAIAQVHLRRLKRQKLTLMSLEMQEG